MAQADSINDQEALVGQNKTNYAVLAQLRREVSGSGEGKASFRQRPHGGDWGGWGGKKQKDVRLEGTAPWEGLGAFGASCLPRWGGALQLCC